MHPDIDDAVKAYGFVRLFERERGQTALAQQRRERMENCRHECGRIKTNAIRHHDYKDNQ